MPPGCCLERLPLRQHEGKASRAAKDPKQDAGLKLRLLNAFKEVPEKKIQVFAQASHARGGRAAGNAGPKHQNRHDKATGATRLQALSKSLLSSRIRKTPSRCMVQRDRGRVGTEPSKAQKKRNTSLFGTVKLGGKTPGCDWRAAEHLAYKMVGACKPQAATGINRTQAVALNEIHSLILFIRSRPFLLVPSSKLSPASLATQRTMCGCPGSSP
jgi:hypothetical protein